MFQSDILNRFKFHFIALSILIVSGCDGLNGYDPPIPTQSQEFVINEALPAIPYFDLIECDNASPQTPEEDSYIHIEGGRQPMAVYVLLDNTESYSENRGMAFEFLQELLIVTLEPQDKLTIGLIGHNLPDSLLPSTIIPDVAHVDVPDFPPAPTRAAFPLPTLTPYKGGIPSVQEQATREARIILDFNAEVNELFERQKRDHSCRIIQILENHNASITKFQAERHQIVTDVVSSIPNNWLAQSAEDVTDIYAAIYVASRSFTRKNSNSYERQILIIFSDMSDTEYVSVDSEWLQSIDLTGFEVLVGMMPYNDDVELFHKLITRWAAWFDEKGAENITFFSVRDSNIRNLGGVLWIE